MEEEFIIILKGRINVYMGQSPSLDGSLSWFLGTFQDFIPCLLCSTQWHPNVGFCFVLVSNRKQKYQFHGKKEVLKEGFPASRQIKDMGWGLEDGPRNQMAKKKMLHKLCSLVSCHQVTWNQPSFTTSQIENLSLFSPLCLSEPSTV